MQAGLHRPHLGDCAVVVFFGDLIGTVGDGAVAGPADEHVLHIRAAAGPVPALVQRGGHLRRGGIEVDALSCGHPLADPAGAGARVGLDLLEVGIGGLPVLLPVPAGYLLVLGRQGRVVEHHAVGHGLVRNGHQVVELGHPGHAGVLLEYGADDQALGADLRLIVLRQLLEVLPLGHQALALAARPEEVELPDRELAFRLQLVRVYRVQAELDGSGGRQLVDGVYDVGVRADVGQPPAEIYKGHLHQRDVVDAPVLIDGFDEVGARLGELPSFDELLAVLVELVPVLE